MSIPLVQDVLWYSATLSLINLAQTSRDCLDGRKGTSNVDRVEKVP